MQIDSPTVRRLRDMLLARAQLGLAQDDHAPKLVHAETSPEVQALIERVAPICEALYLVMIADGTMAQELPTSIVDGTPELVSEPSHPRAMPGRRFQNTPGLGSRSCCSPL